MTATNPVSRRLALSVSAVIALATLASCDGGGGNAPTPTPTMAPAPTPTPAAVTYNVSNCLAQAIPGTGLTVAGAVVPDTLKINLNAASGFPNGRRLADPVIDVTLAVIFLDLTKHSPGTLAGLPLNPSANDKAFPTAFPYLAPPHGNPPLADVGGTTFNFRADPETGFVRVDRMGMPAVSTALISAGVKTGYNDSIPAVDLQSTFVPDIVSTLTGLTNALADDLIAAGLSPCAVKNP